MDVTSAYLNKDLEEEVCVRPPEEIKNYEKSDGVWRLRKALYGLKQDGRAWNKRLDTTLKQFGLQNSKAELCVYFQRKKDKKLIVAIYVDDLLVLSNDKVEKRKLKEYLQKNFEIKDLGVATEFSWYEYPT